MCERKVEWLFAHNGFHTFIPVFGQQPPQDLVAIRGDEVCLVQIRSMFKAWEDKFKKGNLIKCKTKTKEGYGYNVLALCYKDEVALLNDKTLWEGKRVITMRHYYQEWYSRPSTLVFRDYVNPSWLTGENTPSVATEPELSVAV